MLKAEHNKLAHEASISLVEIRNIELQYFMTYFNTMAIQFTFIAGYQMTNYYDTQPISGNSFRHNIQSAFQTCYWFFTVLSVFLAVEGVVVSVYTVVFGQSLALRGPAGSMIRAINGFEREQRLVLILFSLSILFLGIGTIFQFYVVMDWLSAHLCAGVAVVLMYHWYTHTVDVYNRYNYKKEGSEWRRRDDYRRSQVMSDDLEGGPSYNYDNNPLHAAERQRLLQNLRREPSMNFINIMSDPVEARALENAALDAEYAREAAAAVASQGKDKDSGRQSLFQYLFSKRDSDLSRHSDQVDANAHEYFGSKQDIREAKLAAANNLHYRQCNTAGDEETQETRQRMTEPLMSNRVGGLGGAVDSKLQQGLLFEGDIEYRGAGGGNRDRWESCYIVLKGGISDSSALLSFYESEELYHTLGVNGMCKDQRPLELSQYCYRVVPSSGSSSRDVVLLTLLSAMRSSTVVKASTIELRCKSEKIHKTETAKLVAVIALFSPPASALAVQTV